MKLRQFFAFYKRAFPHSVKPEKLARSLFWLIDHHTGLGGFRGRREEDREGEEVWAAEGIGKSGVITFRQFLLNLCLPCNRYKDLTAPGKVQVSVLGCSYVRFLCEPVDW